MTGTEFSAFLKEEVRKVKGIAYPVRAGLLRRTLVREVPLRKLRPNPDDEFCLPGIGPNDSIVSGYMQTLGRPNAAFSARSPGNKYPIDPLIVQRIRPGGYMILNGHHRWAAACRMGLDRVPVRIVNLTQESDLRRMVAFAASPRRVTLDLDEVVFRPESDPCLEKPLPFPLRKWYRDRLRLGVPALFYMLNSRRYDIWVYTARYLSMEHLRNYFRLHRLRVTGIVTGTGRKSAAGPATRKRLEALLAARYETTVHVDNDTVLRTGTGSGAFEEYRLSGNSSTWSREVIDLFEKMGKDG